MRFLTVTTAAALLTLTACSGVSKDSAMGESNNPSSMEAAKPADLDHSPAPMNQMDAEPASMNDSDASVVEQKSVYTSREPLVEPTLSAACGWTKPTVFFATDSAKVGLVGDVKIDLLATCLNNDTLANDPIVITGYADERGTEDYNRKLGLERANAVKKDLVDAGVSASRIETYSKGEYFVDADDKHQDDRRVVIKLDK